MTKESIIAIIKANDGWLDAICKDLCLVKHEFFKLCKHFNINLEDYDIV